MSSLLVISQNNHFGIVSIVLSYGYLLMDFSFQVLISTDRILAVMVEGGKHM